MDREKLKTCACVLLTLPYCFLCTISTDIPCFSLYLINVSIHILQFQKYHILNSLLLAQQINLNNEHLFFGPFLISMLLKTDFCKHFFRLLVSMLLMLNVRYTYSMPCLYTMHNTCIIIIHTYIFYCIIEKID